MTDNLTAWAITQGYDPAHNYGSGGGDSGGNLKPGYASEHFKFSEFRCKCCGELHPDGDKPPETLLNYLEDIRAAFGAPVHINSGYRCPAHNAAVGGATSSQHMAGTAADIWIEEVSPKLVYDYADQLIGDGGGVGKYATFTHIDARGYRARW